MPLDGKIGSDSAAKGKLDDEVGHETCMSCQVRHPKTELHAIKSPDGSKVIAWICGRCFVRGFD